MTYSYPIGHSLCLEWPFNPSLLAKTIHFFPVDPEDHLRSPGEEKQIIGLHVPLALRLRHDHKWVSYTPEVVSSFLKVWTGFYSPVFLVWFYLFLQQQVLAHVSLNVEEIWREGVGCTGYPSGAQYRAETVHSDCSMCANSRFITTLQALWGAELCYLF